MERVEIASLYKATPADGTKVTVCGWAKTVRDSKKIGFISLADGSCYKPVQIVFQADKLENYAEVAKSGLYTSFEVTGTLVLTPNAKQPFEINADTVTVLGTCGSDYPLQKNKMGMDYLRTLTHLRPRTNTFNAAFRVRGQAAYALHEFFHKNGFTYVHTPIFTGSDCEGAGEMFQVTTLDLNDVPKTEDGKLDVGTAVGHSGTLTVIKDLNIREPYVGTIDLLGGEIAEDVAAYYVESEQIPSACGLGVLIDRDRSVLTAGGYLIQLLPGAGEDVITKVEGGIYAAPSVTNILKENPNPAAMLKMVLSDFDMEILSVDPIEYRCYCSRERTERALLSLGSKDLEQIVEEQGGAELSCQFCDKVQTFTADELRAMIADLKARGK